jgi:glycosyltransferase involved in cell wall biosynthesis
VIYFDRRWEGAHGIGRFAAEVLSRIAGVPLNISGNPADRFDSIRLSMALRNLPSGSMFFSPGYNAPLVSPVPFVFTIHDLNHIDRPENRTLLKQIYYSTILRSACNRAERILTVSEFSKNRIAEWSGISRELIVNVGNGVDPGFNPGVEPYVMDEPYMLCVGNRKAHKNETRVVDAFSRSKMSRDVRLVFTGEKTPDLIAKIKRSGVAERVVFAGSVPDNRMPSLYRGALALVFPSLYEGFGLPVLEAMSCGTPVITSNSSSLPEVAGGAGLLVNPESVEELASVIDHLLSDEALQEELRTKGLLRAKEYTWERTAARVRNVLGGTKQ